MMHALVLVLTGFALAAPADDTDSGSGLDVSAIIQQVTKLDDEAQQAWFRTLEARVNRANVLTLRPEEAATRNAQLAAALRQKNLSWDLVALILRETDHREKIAVDRLFRDFRRRVYDTFHADRAEYERRLEAGDRMMSAWNKTGRAFAFNILMIDWLEKAIASSQAGATAGLPPIPKFELAAPPNAGDKQPPKPKEGEQPNKPKSPDETPSTPKPAPPEKNPTPKPAPPEKNRAPENDDSQSADPPKKESAPASVTPTKASEPVKSSPPPSSGAATLSEPPITVQRRPPAEPARPSPRAEKAPRPTPAGEPTRPPKTSYDARPPAKLVLPIPTGVPVFEAALPETPQSAGGTIRRQHESSGDVLPAAALTLISVEQEWPPPLPAPAAPDRHAQASAPVTAADERSAVGQSRSPVPPEIARLPSPQVLDEPPGVQVNVADLAARIAGNTLEMRALESDLDDAATPWDTDRLERAVARLRTLVVQQRDLATFRDLVHANDRQRLDAFESPQAVIAQIGKRIFEARSRLSDEAQEPPDAARRAALDRLERLSTELAKLTIEP